MITSSLRTCGGHRRLLESCRRWIGDDAHARKQALKRKEMLRARDTAAYSGTLRSAVAKKRSEKVGAKDRWETFWLGNRSRGGGWRDAIIRCIRLIRTLGLCLGAPVYFFYDDGKSCYYTRALVCKELSGIPNTKVLDVGTGNGELCKMMAVEVGFQGLGGSVLSVDLSASSISQLKSMLRSRGITNAEAEVQDVLELPNRLKERGDEHFTHTVIAMCLHELDPMRRIHILDAVAKVTKGGKIIVQDFTPAAYGAGNFSMVRNTIFELISGHFTYYMSWCNTGGLEALVCDTGFVPFFLFRSCLFPPLNLPHNRSWRKWRRSAWPGRWSTLR